MTDKVDSINKESLMDSSIDAINHDTEVITELSEDMEVIGPGQMLLQARNQLGLSQQEIANRLNLRVTLLANIEADVFDSSLPETFNRGYLRAYAKLVNISVEDVLASYEMLSVAKIQCAEMQSFSRITEKQAQNSRLMWVSYFILALLIGSTVVWWVQEQNTNKEKITSTQTVIIKEKTADLLVASPSLINPSETIPKEAIPKETTPTTAEIKTDKVENTAVNNDANLLNADVNQQSLTSEISQATFTFSGDCWVNIYDAAGERVAWGVKKAGYVMSISGKAPFKVTVGKPELAVISFNGQDIDMSKFNSGNIAKFTLPLTE
jgi:cytoskeleton protein RodZ